MLRIIALSLLSLAIAAPAPMLRARDLALAERADGGNAYTGNGGQAVGGTNTAVNSAGAGEGLVGDNAQVLDMFSDNAGDGGKAKSGDSFGGHGSTSYAWVNGYWVPVGGKGGDAYTGLGGNANGGNKWVVLLLFPSLSSAPVRGGCLRWSLMVRATAKLMDQGRVELRQALLGRVLRRVRLPQRGPRARQLEGGQPGVQQRWRWWYVCFPLYSQALRPLNFTTPFLHAALLDTAPGGS